MNQYIDWITEEIKQICVKCKKRVAGSESERAAGDYMADSLSKWADTVIKEDFAVHPQAFIGSFALQAFCSICSTICFLLSALLYEKRLAVLSICFLFLVSSSFIFESVFYRQYMDFLYPKQTSQNILAVRKAAIETKQRIIICGHADAAYEMPLLQRSNAVVFIYTMISLAIIGFFLCITFDVLLIFANLTRSAIIIFCVLEVLFIIPHVFFLFFIDWRTVVDGANDNLTGCLLGMSILKEMADHNQRLNYTDVCCLITGGEESGLRGAFAYAKAHRQELMDTNSIVIAVDTIHEADQLMIYPRGINFTQKNSDYVCNLLRKAGKESGISLADAGFFPGANDSEAFSRNGIEAAALCAVRHTPTDYYHIRTDTWDNLDKEGIALTRSVLQRAITIYEKQSFIQKRKPKTL